MVEYGNDAIRALAEGGPERDELEILLADVRRIADGLDGIKQLIVEGAPRRPGSDPIDSNEFARLLLGRFRKMYAHCINNRLVEMSITVGVLGDAIRVLETRVDRR